MVGRAPAPADRCAEDGGAGRGVFRRLRPGSTLVEAIVALVLFGGGVLAIAGVATSAVGSLRTAEARVGAMAAMTTVADSLLQWASPVSGAAVLGRYALGWQVADSGRVATVRINVRWSDGSRLRSDSIEVHAGEPPARLHVVP